MGLVLRVQILILVVAVWYILASDAQSIQYKKDKYGLCEHDGKCKWYKQKKAYKKYRWLFENMEKCKECSGYPIIEADKIPFPFLKTVSCCTTNHYCTYYNKRKNCDGNECYILQLPACNAFQYSTIGTCRVYGTCGGNRKRNCKQRIMIQKMLAVCKSKKGKAKLRWHAFKLPSSCECL